MLIPGSLCTHSQTVSVHDVPKIEKIYPLVVSKLRELCQLRVAQNRGNGHSCQIAEASEADLFVGGTAQKCTQNLKTVIAQMHRDLLIIKEQRSLVPAAGTSNSKVLKLMTASSSGADGEPADSEMVSISCVVSGGGELLRIEHTTAGIACDGLRSLGFFVPGRSARRWMEIDEVWRLAGGILKGRELQLFGCSVVVHDQQGAAASGEVGDSEGAEGREIHLFSWLDEELESLVEALDALVSSDSSHAVGSDCLPQLEVLSSEALDAP